MLNPSIASQNIKERFINYIKTSIQISDPDYYAQFIEQLNADGGVANGPFLEITDSFEKKTSIRQLVAEGVLSNEFLWLEPENKEKKELSPDITLYVHQEQAVRRAVNGQNLIITTGTGSGKTECFLIPIINHILREQEKGKLYPGPYALIIYPMNALVNDQIKRLAKLLANYQSIKFGCFTGDVEEEPSQALIRYREIHGRDPLPNERISRKAIRQDPPHILITNYAMLEYLMLRPGDTMLFDGPYARHYKYLVLDEAHVYGGATGMEVAMLIRRVKARLNIELQCLLTSATLGSGDESNKDIISFACNLCDVPFEEDGIIRAKRVEPIYNEVATLYPLNIYKELCNTDFHDEKLIRDILRNYGFRTNFLEIGQMLGSFFLQDAKYREFRSYLSEPKRISDIAERLNMSEEEMIYLVNALSKATYPYQDVPLVQARYHYFLRALEGAYITLPSHRKLCLERVKELPDEKGHKWPAFEIAICSDCGALYLMGVEMQGHLVSQKTWDKEGVEYYLLKDYSSAKAWVYDEETESPEENKDNDMYICAYCGVIIHASQELPCSCGKEYKIALKQIEKNKQHLPKGCLACSSTQNGLIKNVTLGANAATSVLATALYEQLPNKKISFTHDRHMSESVDSYFGEAIQKTSRIKETEFIAKQFLCFSDSRQEAAFFPCYLGQTYAELLRRQALFLVLEDYSKDINSDYWTAYDLVSKLQIYFEKIPGFSDMFEYNYKRSVASMAKRQAWITVLNEMINSNRRNSLSSLGMIIFECKAFPPKVGNYANDTQETKALLEPLIRSFRLHGALQYEQNVLNEDDRRYLLYAPSHPSFQIVTSGKASPYLLSFQGRQYRGSEKLYINSRLDYLMRTLSINEKDANNILGQFWDYLINKNYLYSSELKGMQMPVENIRILTSNTITLYRCSNCGQITHYSFRGICPSYHCKGELLPVSKELLQQNNHYANLYRAKSFTAMVAKEHTAQLERSRATQYQTEFIQKKINVLSCSTTFEMGVDVGDLEIVFLRNVPPNPANYAQRAGRAGRRKDSAAFSLTYCKLSSHDYHYFGQPIDMISGKIQPPHFSIENPKVAIRHVYATALGRFFAQNKDRFGKVSSFVDNGGPDLFMNYLNEHPHDLKSLLRGILPQTLHESFGINSFSWLDDFIGDNGTFTMAIKMYQHNKQALEEEIKRFGQLERYEDQACLKHILNKLGEEELIAFFVRGGILPKYGFPVDTVELQPSLSTIERQPVSLNRDLQLAVSEYAPGCEVVADGKVWTSRYIRKLPVRQGGNEWKLYYTQQCSEPECRSINIWENVPPSGTLKCKYCDQPLKDQFNCFIQPLHGFIAEGNSGIPGTEPPSRTYRSQVYYVGDRERNDRGVQDFDINGKRIRIESTGNDQLLVRNTSEFFVCDICGYSELVKPNETSPNKPSSDHLTAQGGECKSEKMYRRGLGHVFKTDVAQLYFMDDNISIQSEHSVLYALLEGISRALEIERRDIDGCIQHIRLERHWKTAFILYDVVPGGAGHVSRLSKDSSIIQSVINQAYDLVKNCKCGGEAANTSCYMCLRNYGNQLWHDELQRDHVLQFLYGYIN